MKAGAYVPRRTWARASAIPATQHGTSDSGRGDASGEGTSRPLIKEDESPRTRRLRAAHARRDSATRGASTGAPFVAGAWRPGDFFDKSTLVAGPGGEQAIADGVETARMRGRGAETDASPRGHPRAWVPATSARASGTFNRFPGTLGPTGQDDDTRAPFAPRHQSYARPLVMLPGRPRERDNEASAARTPNGARSTPGHAVDSSASARQRTVLHTRAARGRQFAVAMRPPAKASPPVPSALPPPHNLSPSMTLRASSARERTLMGLAGSTGATGLATGPAGGDATSLLGTGGSTLFRTAMQAAVSYRTHRLW